MYVAKAKDRPVRIGFVATKHIGHAFARNRAKRLTVFIGMNLLPAMKLSCWPALF